MPRKYVKIDEYGKEILELKCEGKTNREIAQKLGVDRKCIRNWVFRFNRQQRKLAAGIKLRPKGRPRKDAQPRDVVAEQAYEINRLKMENTIHLAMKSGKTESRRELHLHSDQGFQYTSQAYFNLTKKYGILPAMSRRGNCYDSALAENFFGILKTECIYRHKPQTFEEANKTIDDYIYIYNHERIQLKRCEDASQNKRFPRWFAITIIGRVSC